MRRPLFLEKTQLRGFWCCDTRVFANSHEEIEVLLDLAKFQEERPGSGFSIAKVVDPGCPQEIHVK